MRAANATHSNAVPTIFRHVAFICVFIAFIVLFVLTCVMPPNDPSSATRRTGRNNCNRDAPAGFAAAHG